MSALQKRSKGFRGKDAMCNVPSSNKFKRGGSQRCFHSVCCVEHRGTELDQVDFSKAQQADVDRPWQNHADS